MKRELLTIVFLLWVLIALASVTHQIFRALVLSQRPPVDQEPKESPENREEETLP